MDVITPRDTIWKMGGVREARGKYYWYRASRTITCRISDLKVVAHGRMEGFRGKCFDRRVGLFM